ncbi:MAG: acyl-CoA thioesterase [Thermoleophilaceae bacterium]
MNGPSATSPGPRARHGRPRYPASPQPINPGDATLRSDRSDKVAVRLADRIAVPRHNAVYLSYFEASRAGYYASLTGHPFGSGPDAARETFVIAEAHIAYRSPARFGEPLACWCRVSWAGRSSFELEYRVEAEASPLGDARLVAEGSSVQVFYDLGAAAPMRMPRELLARIEAYQGGAVPGRVVGG